MCSRILAGYCLVISLVTTQATVSEFEKYPAEARLMRAPARVKLDTPKARRFRTRLLEAARAGPNFNGHYHVTRWGCGTNCIEWAVIDLATGKVWLAPEPAFSCWAVDEPSRPAGPDWFAARVESSLLYLHQCAHGPRPSDRTFDTRYVYVWSNAGPRLLRTDRLSD